MRAFGDAELLGDQAADMVRHLGRAVERELVARRIDGRDRGARLDRRPDQAVVDEIDARHMGGGLQRLLHRRFVAARPAEADIAGRIVVELRRARLDRRARIDHDRQRRIGDLDRLGGVERLRARFGDDGGDRLADMADRVARERTARRLGHRPAVARADDPERPHGTTTPSAAMSAPVKTATTPGRPRRATSRSGGCAHARAASARSTQCSSPGRTMSATKRPRPSRKRRSSTRRSGGADALVDVRLHSIAVPRAPDRAARTPTCRTP